MKVTIAVLVALVFLSRGASEAFGDLIIGQYTVGLTDADYLAYGKYLRVPLNLQEGDVFNGTNVAAIKAMEGGTPAAPTVQRQIFDVMQALQVPGQPIRNTYEFADVFHARAVVRQRLETISMIRTFNTTHNYWYAFSNPASTNRPEWEPTPPYRFFRQKNTAAGGTPWQAISSLCAPHPAQSFGECEGAIVACVWWGASRAMGEIRFNNLYTNRRLDMRFFEYERSKGANPATRIIRPAGADMLNPVPGDWIYFQSDNYTKKIANIPKLSVLMPPPKLWNGENAIYIGALPDPDVATSPPLVRFYEGLGVAAAKELTFRKEVAKGYNGDTRKLREKYDPPSQEGQSFYEIPLDNTVALNNRIHMTVSGRPTHPVAPVIPIVTTTTGLQSSNNPQVVNQPLTLTATVTAPAGGGTPCGAVMFRRTVPAVPGGIPGFQTLAVKMVNLSGVATLNISTLPVGSHTISAQYLGCSLFQSSNSGNLIQGISN